jgi:hypothetical protein
MKFKLHKETKMTPSQWNEMVEQKKFEDRIKVYMDKRCQAK